MKKILPALVAGIIVGLVEIIPVVKSLTCCILIPIATYYAMTLEIKGNKKETPFTIGEGIRFGILTGIFGAFFTVFFDSFLTFILKTNDFVSVFPQMQNFFDELGMPEVSKQEVLSILQGIVEDIKEYGFSPVYSFAMLVSGTILNIIFGLLGGLIDVKFINKKYFS